MFSWPRKSRIETKPKHEAGATWESSRSAFQANGQQQQNPGRRCLTDQQKVWIADLHILLCFQQIFPGSAIVVYDDCDGDNAEKELCSKVHAINV